MNELDRRLMKKCEENFIVVELIKRYADDIRVLMRLLKVGCRWDGKEVVWSKEAEGEDVAASKSGVQITCEVIQKVLDTLMPGLTFTTESEEEFGGWLPTLDTQLKVINGKIQHKFFEKDMKTPLVIMQNV